MHELFYRLVKYQSLFEKSLEEREGVAKKILRYLYIKISSPFGFLFYKNMEPVSCSSLFENKIVAIVGPAADLSGQGLGDKIDQADVVVKFNRMIDFDQSQEVDYGEKIDILFHGLLPGGKVGNCGKIEPLRWKKKGLGAVIYPFYLESTGYCVANYFIKGGATLRTYKLLPEKYYHISDMLKSRPTSGMLAIILALKGDAKRVDVYGFSFFKTQHNSDYFKGKNSLLVDEKKFNHSSDKEFELVERLIKESGKLNFVFPNPFS
ncbi:glycosyltransferase family 29 protein [Halomonas sp. M20]|uniref:glycosyltransferase family 29 protein n=1 Tax=Halomonas sp. M20 TaxID=2763264 RepID=UPI001D0B5506|nr:glycosyltransferase family 29 protein [Halomonas sp. M20]